MNGSGESRKEATDRKIWKFWVPKQRPGLEQQLGHHPKAGQWQTGVEELCCCPICKLAWWVVRNEWMNLYTSYPTNWYINLGEIVSSDQSCFRLVSIKCISQSLCILINRYLGYWINTFVKKLVCHSEWFSDSVTFLLLLVTLAWVRPLANMWPKTSGLQNLQSMRKVPAKKTQFFISKQILLAHRTKISSWHC